jgi:hypothetical protein
MDHEPVKAAFDLAVFGYRRVPARLAELAANARAALQTSAKPTGGKTMTLEEVLAALQGLPEEERKKATEEQKSKAARALGITIPVDNSKALEEAQAAGRLKDEQIALLQAEKNTAAKEAADLRLERTRAEKTQAIEAALAAGKIAPVNRELWEKQYDKDPEGTRALLAAQQPVVDLGERGVAAGGEESELTVEELAMAAKAGLSEEDVKKYGPKGAGKEK